jgi:hypothetical protein
MHNPERAFARKRFWVLFFFGRDLPTAEGQVKTFPITSPTVLVVGLPDRENQGRKLNSPN